MSAKYAAEMILIPKPSSCHQEQSGGQVTPDTMDQFWQRRLLVDQLTTAPHVDRMMKLLSDMKGVEGQALPSSLPGQGPSSSDYFRLQGQLKIIPAQPVKRPLPSKASVAAVTAAAAPKPSGRPPTARSFEEAVQQRAEIEKRLDEYKNKAKQDMEEALKWGDDEAIKKVDYNWRIVTGNINDIREENRFFNEPSLVDQVIYGKEEEKRRKSAREAHERRLDNLWRQLKDMYPNQEGKGSKPPVWQKPRGWIQE